VWVEAHAPLGCDDVERVADLIARAPIAVVDLRGAGPRGLGMAVLQRMLAWQHEAWWRDASPRRLTLVQPPNPAGALAMGLAHALGEGATVAASPEDAAASHGTGALVRAVADPLAAARALNATWAAVRRACLARPDADLATVAQALGATRRALQRQLAERDTSYRAEQSRAVLELAYEQVVAGRAKLTAIARELGFASESQLSRAFRRRFGAPPQALREARP